MSSSRYEGTLSFERGSREERKKEEGWERPCSKCIVRRKLRPASYSSLVRVSQILAVVLLGLTRKVGTEIDSLGRSVVEQHFLS
jgi:hypothetical protein